MLVATSVSILRLDKEWTTIKLLTGKSATSPITTACDGALLVGHGDPPRISRLEADGTLSSLDVTDPMNRQVATFARHPSGALVVLQTSKIYRTLP